MSIRLFFLVAILSVAVQGCQQESEEKVSAETTTAEKESAEEMSEDSKEDQPEIVDFELPSLSDKLAARKAEFAKQAPEELRNLFANGVKQVAETGIVEQAKQVGDIAPSGTLQTAAEETVELDSLWSDGPVVLVWYRGGWCPYCNLQLEAMQGATSTLERLGAKVVALTPELPPKAAATQEKLRVGFQILSDPGNELARKFGLVFKLPPEVAKVYKDRIKLKEYNGDDSYELPLSAVYVIDTQGIIRYAFLDADYTKRAEPADIVAAVKSLSL
ncbi:MAG: peroxiredoxin-like family protein [Lacipirellulaceae bacterium]